MRLKKLRVQSYRNHQDSTLTIGDATFVVLRGANGAGKTSLVDGFSMNMAQTCVSLSGDGKGYVKKIAQGEGKSTITAEVETDHLFKSTVVLNVNTSGRTSDAECLDVEDEQEARKAVTEFKKFLTDNKPALLIAANTNYFQKLEEKEQTNLLAKLVLPSRYDFPQDKIEATNGYLDAPINFDAEPFEVISKSYKLLYKEREVANRQVKEFTIPDSLPIPKGVDSESLNAQLTGIREQRTKLQKERDAAVAKANEIEVKRATLTTKIVGLRAEVERGKKRLGELDAFILPDDKVKELTALAGKADELAKLKTEHAGIHNSILVYSKEIKRFNEILEQGKTCPVCDQDIDESKMKTAIDALKEEHAAADQKIQALDTKIESIGDIAGAKESLRKHDAAVKERTELTASLMKTVETGKATKAELEALPEASNATLPFNDPLSGLQAQEDKLNEQLRPVIQAEERKVEIDRLTKQKDKLVAKAAKLNELVIYWDKDGVKKTLISQYIGGFEGKINSVLDAFGCSASLAFDPMSFDVTTKRGYVGSIKELCGAEEEIFKRAFQCAVAIASGIKMVVIDEMEELGSDIRAKLFGAVYGLMQDGLLEQAIFIEFSLDKTTPPKEKRVPNSRYFYVEDGTVEELK